MSKRGILLLGLAMAVPVPAQEAGFRWPNGARAAVSLTYDDGIDSQLDHALPDLEAFGLRATFYVSGGSDSLRRRMDEWRELARRGHEIGNHSLFHPCLSGGPERGRQWVKPEQDLKDYTVRRIVEELRVANVLLTALDGRQERTYAFTCADELAGSESYVDAIKPLFPFARSGRDPGFTPEPDGRDEVVTDLRSLDLYRVPSWMIIDNGAEEMIAFVEKAVATGGLAVLMFHGVEGEYLNVSRRAHQQLLEYLDQNRDRIWTDTFLAVMKHVQAERQRLGWESASR